jgi:peptide/nickel transport system permease protein
MSVGELAFDAEPLARPQEESQLKAVWRRFRRHRLAVLGLVIIALLALAVFVGPLLSPYDPNDINARLYAQTVDLGPLSRAPDGFHILGTDRNGRDYLTRLMQGGRISLALAITVTVVAQTFGVLVGGVAGYYGHWLDSAIMRLVDFMLTLPTLPLLLALYALLPMRRIPGGSLSTLAIVLIVFGWMQTSRLVRGMVLSLKNQDFAEAARSVGASDWRIILHHMIPNAMAPALVSATLAVGGIVIYEAALSFLGFGVQPPDASWGNMLLDVQGKMLTDPFEVFYPGMAIFLASVSFNFVGDALRDALDPRLTL